MSNALTKRFRVANAGFRELGIILAFLALFLVFAVLSPYFLEIGNLLNVLRQVSLIGIMGIGMTMVIVTGEIDLSVSATYGLTAIVSGLLLVAGFPAFVCVLAALAVGFAVGAVNGLLVSYGRIPSIIVTLGMLNIARGISLLVTQGIPVIVSNNTVDNTPALERFLAMGQHQIFGHIPIMAVFLLGLTAIGWVAFQQTLIGFRMRAIGGNASAAQASGINVRRVKTMAFAINGLMAGFAGVLNIAFITNVRADSGSGLELTVIASVIIGGTSLQGGEGTMLGTLFGVLIIGVLRNGLVLLGVSPFWQVPILGVVIIGAVAIDIWLRKRRV